MKCISCGHHLVFAWCQMLQKPFMLPPVNLQPPKPIAVGDNLASNLKQWKKVWQRYEISAKKDDVVRLSILLSVIGEDAVKAFDTFVWKESQKEDTAKDVNQICWILRTPHSDYSRTLFNDRKQEGGESISEFIYVTTLCVIVKSCAHDEITPGEIVSDRFALGVRDEKIRE